MSGKLNCWQIKRCGREPHGKNLGDLGACPAALAIECDGINGGERGGRICWVYAGTFCGGVVQGVFAQKFTTCISCPVYGLVAQEQGDDFQLLLRRGQI